MDSFNVEMSLEDTIASLIIQVVSLRTELVIQKASLDALYKQVSPAMVPELEAIREGTYHQSFVEQLDLAFPQISDSWRDAILKQIEIDGD